jgi:hypothetical protein
VNRKSGAEGRLWGATRHGLIIDFGHGAPLLTLDLREVSLVKVKDVLAGVFV